MNESLCKAVACNVRTVARELRVRGIELDLLVEVHRGSRLGFPVYRVGRVVSGVPAL